MLEGVDSCSTQKTQTVGNIFPTRHTRRTPGYHSKSGPHCNDRKAKPSCPCSTTNDDFATDSCRQYRASVAEQPDIDAVVFSGGGARCFWQAGFWEAVRSALPVPTAISAVSGGAAVAAILFAGGWSRFFAKFLELAASNERNVRLRNFLRRRPVFPHPAISRESFLHAVSARALQALRTGPDFHIVISHPPRLLGARLGALLAVAAEEMEKRLTGRLSSRWVRGLGFHSSVVRARECHTPAALVHAILQSSTAPPMFPVTRHNGYLALDGGLVDNVPLSAVAECRRPLVLLSRPERALPVGGREVYACPSGTVPVSAWDFSSPDKVIETFELGRRDGARFREDLAA